MRKNPTGAVEFRRREAAAGVATWKLIALVFATILLGAAGAFGIRAGVSARDFGAVDIGVEIPVESQGASSQAG